MLTLPKIYLPVHSVLNCQLDYIIKISLERIIQSLWANFEMATPKTWLKSGHNLKGKDVLPVVMRLQALYKSDPEEFASLSKKYLLESYTKDHLAREFKEMTGYDIEVRNVCFHY